MGEFNLNGYRRTADLEQITPMIHFQHKEPGATLRASEVKPKLDRFIIRNCGGIAQLRTKHGDWVDREHDALKYKVQFVAKGTAQEQEEENPHKLYFGNTGVDESRQKQTVFYPEGICMTIISKYESLLNKIEAFLPYFFALSAFGTRSGKGFGCFMVKNKALDYTKLKCYCPRQLYYSISYSTCTPPVTIEETLADIKKKLDDIWVLSGMMKSGFNFTFGGTHPTDYYKGFIFQYFSARGIGNDKAFIKQKVLKGRADRDRRSEEYVNHEDFRFIRAMLGLPGGFEFRSGPRTSRRGKVVVASKQIDRFQSPVHFCVHRDRLLIVPQEIPEKMLNAHFKLNDKVIHTPTSTMFDLIDFLDAFLLQFNARAGICGFLSKTIRNTLASKMALQLKKTGGGVIPARMSSSRNSVCLQKTGGGTDV